jgi:hypothetical protein
MTKLREFFPKSMQESCDNQPAKTMRFDIFKGHVDSEGRVRKIRSVGSARLSDGYRTYTVQLKTFLDDLFYLLPEREAAPEKSDFAILTREDSTIAGRRFFWNKIGDGALLQAPNNGLLHLSWDVLGTGDIYMSMEPINQGGTTAADLPQAA